MIKLSSHSDVRVHTSNTVSHPAIPGGGSTNYQYVVNHDIGRYIDHAEMIFPGDTSGAEYQLTPNLYTDYPGSIRFRYWALQKQTSKNSVTFTVYTIATGSATDIYFKVTSFGGDHNAT